MANQFQTVTSGLAQLKNYYQGPIVSQFNDEIPVYRAAEKVKQGWSGQQVIRPIKTIRNQGIGAVADNGNLPAVGRQTTAQAIILAKYNYLRFGITGPMIKASQSDIGSFVRSAEYELQEGYKDLKSDVNRQLSWDGTSDIATMSVAAVAATSITVAGRETVEPALKFLDIGVVFDIYTAAGALVQSSITVNAITTGTATSLTAVITTNVPVTASATNVLVRAGSFGNEIQGLLTALDGGTTSIFSIDRSVTPSFQGNVGDVGGGQLTLDQMQTQYNEGMRRGGVRYNGIYCDFDSLRFYQKLLTADKRYVNEIKGDGGFANKDQFYLDFNGIAVVPDKDCPRRMFFLDSNHLKAYVLSELEFADETGSMYIAQTGVDALEVRIRFFMNYFNEQPNASAVLKNYISP